MLPTQLRKGRDAHGTADHFVLSLECLILPHGIPDLYWWQVVNITRGAL